MRARKNNYAFIDSQNVYLGTKKLDWSLDYYKFRRYLAEKYQISKAFIFIGFIKKNQPLYSYLKKCGFLLIYKPVQSLPNRQIKGNMDAELVLQTMVEMHNFNQALIATSDGDFYCLIKYLRSRNKLLSVLSPSKKYCSRLLKIAASEKIVYIEDLREKLQRK